MINNFTMILCNSKTPWKSELVISQGCWHNLSRQQLGLTPNLLCWGVFCTLTSRRGREDERVSSLTAGFDVNYTSVSVSCARFSSIASSESEPAADSLSSGLVRTHENLWPGTEAAVAGGLAGQTRGELPRCFCATHFLLTTIAVRTWKFQYIWRIVASCSHNSELTLLK